MRKAQDMKRLVCTANATSPSNLVCREVSQKFNVASHHSSSSSSSSNNNDQNQNCAAHDENCLCDLDFNQLLTSLVDMRLLWADHVLYTRLAVEEVVEGSVLTGTRTTGTIGRMYQNQQDLGNNLAIFYCDANGRQYADILTRHIDAAVQVLTGLVTNNTQLVNQGAAAATANAREFAQFWACINPFINEEELFQHMQMHIATLVDLMKALIAAIGANPANPTLTQDVVTQQDDYTQATDEMSLMFFDATLEQWERDCDHHRSSHSRRHHH